MNYRLSLDLEALHFLFAVSVVNRRNLLRWLEGLKNAPFSTGQSIVLDPTGRDIQVSIFSHFRIFHWTDHPVKTVRVLKIELND
ncbi:MAG: hypothetical protein LV480_12365 [Methylacidiphilales bacterium]|nr:hypothetical protein [Candidatus Methylacidiphilales bacterium]